MKLQKLAIALACIFLSGTTAYSFTIAKNGQAACEVIVGEDATASEQFAADELVKYVEKISGAALEVKGEADAGDGAAISVGRTKAAAKQLQRLEGTPADSFVIDIDENVILVGDCGRATLYAVYELLEGHIGCRWLAPGAMWEEVPQKKTIQVTAGERIHSPDMRYRFNRMTPDRPNSKFARSVLDWSVKRRINIGSGWPGGGSSQQVVKRGGFRAYMHPHIIDRLLPTEEYFDEHPKWYALVNGKRKDRGRWTQLCTTNSEVIDVVARKVGDLFDKYPELEFFGLGQADGTAFCECDRCTALDTGEMWSNRYTTKSIITERWLTFVNAVAKKLQKTHPDKKIYTLAYHQTVRPPDPSVISPEPNVMIQLVNSRPNYVCFVHRFEKENCSHHARFRNVLDKWVDMTPAGVMIYEYVQHSTFSFMPFAAPHKFAADIDYLDDAGVLGFEAQSVRRMWGVYGITHYAVSKALWNADLSADELVADYCQHAFRGASKPMQRFYGSLQQGLEDAECITRGIWTYMTPEVMQRALEHLDAAQEAANSKIVRKRLEAIDASFTLGERGSAAWWKAQRAREKQKPEMLEEAIAEAEALMQWVREQNKQGLAHHVGIGKLKLQVKRWRNWLEAMRE